MREPKQEPPTRGSLFTKRVPRLKETIQVNPENKEDPKINDRQSGDGSTGSSGGCKTTVQFVSVGGGMR